ncbi:ribosome-associated translation inhibitor RaiA [Candidatus Saccharibacteria bacterium]|nr:ribosome-associated translation inhibitor RaiA [Candidatus Saccharibacteria bacterium]
MIEKIEMSGNGYKIDVPLKKYVEKRLGKLDKYLPRGTKKDVVMKVSVTEVGKNKSEKYDISVTMETTGGKVMTAKDECSNVFAGIDLVEAKLLGQIRRYKLEMQPHRQKKNWKNIFHRGQ